MTIIVLRKLPGYQVLSVPSMPVDAGAVCGGWVILGPTACRGSALIRARRVLRVAGHLSQVRSTGGACVPSLEHFRLT